jgi:hypothetical protein
MYCSLYLCFYLAEKHPVPGKKLQTNFVCKHARPPLDSYALPECLQTMFVCEVFSWYNSTKVLPTGTTHFLEIGLGLYKIHALKKKSFVQE